jgi:hypothetical protein
MQLKAEERDDMLNALDHAIVCIVAARERETLSKIRDWISVQPLKDGCHDCLHRCESSNGPYCHHWNATIPIEWMSAGCDQWEDDIPF